MGRKRVTIQDIADRTGYSKTAVSFAFNSPSRISKDAVEKILAVAREMDYIPDPMARNFSLGHHMAIGFMIPQSVSVTLENPYIQSVMRSIASVCEDHGYMLTVIPPLHSSIEEAVKSATVDGVIAMGLSMDRSVTDILRRRGLRTVSIDGTGDAGLPSVYIDDRAAAREQMRTVLAMGHRRIAVIALPSAAYGGKRHGTLIERRMEGYEEALREYSMTLSDILLIQTDATFGSGYEAAGRIIAEGGISCIVTMSDIVALGAWRAIRDKGLRVPDEISIMGFDGIDDHASKELSTVMQSADDKGRISAQMLFSMIDGKDEEGTSVKVPFSIREGMTMRVFNGY